MNDVRDPQDTPKPPARPAGSPVWMRVLLVASLAANLLVVGLVAGAVFNGPPPRESGRSPGDVASTIYFGALPPDARREVTRMMWRHARDFREGREMLRTEVGNTLALLRAETVDKDALVASVRSQREQLGQRRELGDRLFIDYVAGMSLEERRAYADRIEEMLQRIWRR